MMLKRSNNHVKSPGYPITAAAFEEVLVELQLSKQGLLAS